MNMKNSPKEAVRSHTLGALSSIENSERIHPEDAFDVLAGYTHLHRFPLPLVEGDLDEMKFVEENAASLAEAAMEELWPVIQSWTGSYQDLVQMDLTQAQREDLALSLWQDGDDASLALDAIGHLLPEEELPEDYGRLTEDVEELPISASDPAFDAIDTYLSRMKDWYTALEDMPGWVVPSTLAYFPGAGRLGVHGLPSILTGIARSVGPVRFFVSLDYQGDGKAGYRWCESSTGGWHYSYEEALSVPVFGWDVEGALQRLASRLEASDYS